jgi:glyoxylase-like metal-dependent hydrolase (beta-lactamase superfamily II)
MRIRSLGGEPVRFVVYTNGQRERILGTQYLVGESNDWARPQHGPLSISVTPARREPNTEAGGGTVVAHKLAWAQVESRRTDSFKQSMIDMLAERDPDIANLEVILPHITLDERVKLYVGDVVVTLLAATKGMLWVWLGEQRVLFTGDIVAMGTHPPLSVTDTKEWLSYRRQSP